MAKTTPVRWWRDDETRYMTRSEYRQVSERRHFNLSDVPRGDNPELDAFVEHWRDTHGFFPCVPLKWERLEPDPLADIRVRFESKMPMPLSFFALGRLV